MSVQATRLAALALVDLFMTRALAAFHAGDLAACHRLEAQAARFEKIADEASR